MISSIVHIAHEYDNDDEPWPIEIEDHNGELHAGDFYRHEPLAKVLDYLELPMNSFKLSQEECEDFFEDFHIGELLGPRSARRFLEKLIEFENAKAGADEAEYFGGLSQMPEDFIEEEVEEEQNEEADDDEF